MKLSDFIEENKNKKLSDIQKLLIYEKYLNKKNKINVFRYKQTIYTKSFGYASIIIMFILGLYGTYFFETKNIPNSKENQDTKVFVLENNTNNVNADYIANIVSFVGSFHIEHNGQEIQTSNIHNGDSIFLTDGTEMIFYIDNQTKAKIIGPAKLTIHKTKTDEEQTKYKIDLHYGDFVEIESIQDYSNQNIEIETKEITVTQESTKSKTNFQLIKNGDSHIVKNNGGKLYVSSNNKLKDNTKSIENSQLANIQGDDINIMSTEEFNESLKNNTISHSFSIKEQTLTNKQDIKNIKDIKDIKDNEVEINITNIMDTKNTLEYILTGENLLTGLMSADISNIQTGIIEEISNLTKTNGLKILTSEQNNLITNILTKKELNDTIKTMFYAKTQNNKTELEKTRLLIENKFKQILTILDIKTSETDKGDLFLVQTQKTIQNTYTIPPKHLKNLETIINRINYTDTQESGKSIEEVDEIRTNLQNNLPSNLMFQ